MSFRLTGTTALEAESTISGSIGMLKASLSDLAAGFGNPDADIQELCDNMSAAFQSVVENITPVVENIADTLPMAAEALLGSVDELLPGLLDAVAELFDTVLTSLLEMLPALAPAAADAVVQVVDTIADNFTVSCSPQFSTEGSFTALDGTVCGEQYIGDIISIRAELQEISTEKAAILSEILNQASFAVNYSDPVSKTATFKKPEVSAVCIFEGDNTEYWNYSISMTSLLVPCSDTESL